MWGSIARFVLKFRLFLLLILAAATAFMSYHASKVQMSYEFCADVAFVMLPDSDRKVSVSTTNTLNLQ